MKRCHPCIFFIKILRRKENEKSKSICRCSWQQQQWCWVLLDVAVLLIKQILQNQKANQNLLHLQT